MVERSGFTDFAAEDIIIAWQLIREFHCYPGDLGCEQQIEAVALRSVSNSGQ